MPADCHLGPRGLPLPSWNPAFAETKAQADRERAEFFKETDEHTKKEYGSKEYWQAFEFGGNADVEWLCSEDFLLPLLPSTKGGSRALVVGCGSSSLSRGLLDQGHTKVTSIDVAEKAVQGLAEKNKGVDGLEFLTMDVTRMDLPDKSFDLVVDKGMIDTLFCGTDARQIGFALLELYRVTADGGSFVCVSHSGDRAPYLGHRRTPWEVSVGRHFYDPENPAEPEADGSVFYVYTCKKICKQSALDTMEGLLSGKIK